MQQDILLKHKIGLRLSRAGILAKIMANQFCARAGHELTPEQYSVLASLSEHNGIYLRQLASITCKDRPNITRIVSILESGEYLTSSLEADGRQVKKLYITEKGKEICEKMFPTIIQVWKDTVNGLSEDEVTVFLGTLDKLENNLREKIVLQN